MKRLVVKYYEKAKYAEEDGHKLVFVIADPANVLNMKAALLYFEDTETGEMTPVEMEVRY